MTIRQTREQDDFAAGPRSLDLREYWLIVRRRWPLIVVIAILGAIGAAEYAHHAGPTYTAQASVVVSAVTQGPQQTSTPATTQVNMSTEQTIAQSPAVIELAAETLGMPATQLQSSAAKRLSVSVPASTLTTSNVLQIDWQAADSRSAQQGANAFASAYLTYRQHILGAQVATLRKNLQSQVSTLDKEISSLSHQLGETMSGTSANQVLTVELTQVSQQYNSTQSQLAAIPAYNVSGGQLIAALPPSKPSGLSRSLLAVVGFIIGLLIGLGIAFGRDLFDDRVRDPSHLEQHLGAATLAVLSASVSRATKPGRTGRRGLPTISMVGRPDSGAAQAVRTMRAAVTAASGRRDLHVILLVSADTSVSSGQVSAELGLALAESGRRVLLVASDLSCSVLPGIFDVPNDTGLSELLTHSLQREVVIYRPQEVSGIPLPTEITEQLLVMPNGKSSSAALSLLDSSRMRLFLRGQSKNYDFVLLDAPPAATADILPLATQIDGVIVLVRGKKTVIEDIGKLRRRLEPVGVPIVGGVLIRERRFLRDLRLPGRRSGITVTSGRPAVEDTDTSKPAVDTAQIVAKEQDVTASDMTAPLPQEMLSEPAAAETAASRTPVEQKR
jgi:Mrp family chromosome partitioning ATPase/capsular polysaccharide biosynthesis protein